MKKRRMALTALLALSISLSACAGNKPVSSNHFGEDKTEETGLETKDSETGNGESGVQAENGTTENSTGISCLVTSDTLTGQTEDDTKDDPVQDGEINPDNPPVHWGTPDGPETAVKNYYANTVFELVSFEIAQASKEHVIFTVTSKKDGVFVEPNRTIELNYEDGEWKVVNEGY